MTDPSIELTDERTMRIDPITAQALLGVRSDANPTQVRSAFRDRVREHHPDAHRQRGDPSPASIDLATLRDAKDLLVERARQRHPFSRGGAPTPRRQVIDLRDDTGARPTRVRAGPTGSARLDRGQLGGEPSMTTPAVYSNSDDLGLVVDLFI